MCLWTKTIANVSTVVIYTQVERLPMKYVNCVNKSFENFEHCDFIADTELNCMHHKNCVHNDSLDQVTVVLGSI